MKIIIEILYYQMAEVNQTGYGVDGNYEMIRIVNGSSYYNVSGYYEKIIVYWEQNRWVTDISKVIEHLYYTNMKYYIAEDFDNDPHIVIHLAKMRYMQ